MKYSSTHPIWSYLIPSDPIWSLNSFYISLNHLFAFSTVHDRTISKWCSQFFIFLTTFLGHLIFVRLTPTHESKLESEVWKSNGWQPKLSTSSYWSERAVFVWYRSTETDLLVVMTTRSLVVTMTTRVETMLAFILWVLIVVLWFLSTYSDCLIDRLQSFVSERGNVNDNNIPEFAKLTNLKIRSIIVCFMDWLLHFGLIFENISHSNVLSHEHIRWNVVVPNFPRLLTCYMHSCGSRSSVQVWTCCSSSLWCRAALNLSGDVVRRSSKYSISSLPKC